MIDPSSEILTAFYNALSGNLSYNSTAWAVYTSVPKSDADKFVVLEELSVGDDNTKDHNKWDCSLTIEVMGEIAIGQVSMKPVDAITSQILNALFKVSLSMPSFDMTTLPWFEDVSKHTDLVGSGILARKAIRVRFGVQEKSVAGINAGESGGTDWLDTNGDGTPNLWEATGSGDISIVSGNGFTGQACRFVFNADGDTLKITVDAAGNAVLDADKYYDISCKYRSSGGEIWGGPIKVKSGSTTAVTNIINTEVSGNAANSNTSQFNAFVTPHGTTLEFFISTWIEEYAGTWIEVDEITITETGD